MLDTTLFTMLKNLWFYLSKKRKNHFIFLLILTLISAFAEVISLGAIFPFLTAITSPDKLVNNKYFNFFFSNYLTYFNNNLLFFITIIFSIIIFISGSIRMLLWWIQTRVSFGVGADFSYEIYKKTLYQAYEVHLSRNSSEVISGIANKVGSIIYSIILPILTIFSSILMILFIGTILFVIDPFITLLSLIVFSFTYFLISFISKNRIKRDSIIISKESTFIFKALQEGLAGIRDVIVDGSQEVYLEIYRNADLPLRRAQGNIHLQSGLPRYFVETMGYIFIGFLAFFLTKNNPNSSLVISRLVVVAIGAQRLLPLIQQLYSNITIIRGSKSNLFDVIELLSQTISKNKTNADLNPIAFNNSIKFFDVSFRYKNCDKNIIDRVNFEILKSKRIGIIGSTGSGKTTLLDLIMGLLLPNNGSIQIDNINLNLNNVENWRKNIAHVPQTIFLSDTTIFENIAFGIPYKDIDDKLVIEAAKKAKIFETIQSLENGFLTTVGERGVRLSGGQRQRIGIARALYKKANVIIFDEATSALDNLTESELMSEIDGLDPSLTLILVAHRLSTLKSCDVIFEIKDGKIIKLEDLNFLNQSFNI
jgi:ABC-type multidrug transport system fused ATPase/permease subunit